MTAAMTSRPRWAIRRSSWVVREPMGAKWPTGFDRMAERRDHLTRQAACLIWMLSAIAPSCGAVEAESGGYYAPSQAKAGAEIYAGHCAGAAAPSSAAPWQLAQWPA